MLYKILSKILSSSKVCYGVSKRLETAAIVFIECRRLRLCVRAFTHAARASLSFSLNTRYLGRLGRECQLSVSVSWHVRAHIRNLTVAHIIDRNVRLSRSRGGPPRRLVNFTQINFAQIRRNDVPRSRR